MIFPTVTEIIRPWVDFSKIPPAVLQHAADRGTAIHDLCARIVRGEFVIPPDEYYLHCQSFRLWLDTLVDFHLLVEERLVDPAWGYSGQIDLLVVLNDERKALVDLKTPVIASKSWRVQLAGYNHLCQVTGHKTDCAGSLQLSPQGNVAKMTWYEDSAGDFNTFVQCLNVYRFFNS